MTDELIEVLPADDGKYYWRKRAGNNEIIATSGETYEFPTDCKEAAKRVFGEEIAFRVVYRDAESEGDEDGE